MAQLGGQFAGILELEIDPGKIEALKDSLQKADPEITFQFGKQLEATAPNDALFVQISICGQDQPGIVEALFTVFSEFNINVEELRSNRRGAPWSGTTLFEATARLRMPGGINLGEVRSRLEGIAEDLAVDLDWIQ